MLYEVFIPAKDAESIDIKFRLKANNWINALKKGLQQMGESGDLVKQALCDILDDGVINVTDPRSGRVFQIIEIGEDFPAPAPDKPVVETQAVEDPRAASSYTDDDLDDIVVDEDDLRSTLMLIPAIKITPPAGFPKVSAESTEHPTTPQQATATPQQATAATQQAAAPDTRPTKPNKAAEAEVRSQPQPQTQREAKQAAPAAERAKPVKASCQPQNPAASKKPEPNRGFGADFNNRYDTCGFMVVSNNQTVEEALSDLFMEVQVIYEMEGDIQKAAEHILNLAMSKVAAESGSILFADINGTDLYFACARGPKADEVMDFRVPMGTGIVGLSALQGISLCISEAHTDSRVYKEIGNSIGYDTKSILCVPIEDEGRCYGALELINKKNGNTFTADELSLTTYLAGRMAEFINAILSAKDGACD